MTTAQSDLLADAPAVEPRLHVTTPMVRDLLRKRYAAPEWAFMEEVAPKTGGGTRYADGVAVNLWSSRGHAVHGFEIKVSRSDWLRELKDPSKAEAVFRYCDHWFIVAPRDVVRAGELPPTWGLLEVRTAGLVAAVAAPKLEAQPMSRAFFASLMRRGFELLDAQAERKIADARAEVERRVEEAIDRRSKEAQSELSELKARLKDLEEKTGITLNRWNTPPVDMIALAKRLQRLQGYKQGGGLGALEDLAAQLRRSADTLSEALAAHGLDKGAAPDGG
jgi:hypothetical protein